MLHQTVDLYAYFDVTRPKGGKGVLTCMAIEAPAQMREHRRNPAILILPGGGYAFVSDREAEPVALRYMAKGFCAFILDYSVAPVRYPAQLVEAAMAMAYIRLEADRFYVAPNKVAALGFSAGGHLCGSLATIFDDAPVLAALKENAHLIRPDAAVLAYPVITSGEKAHADSFKNLCGEDADLKARLSLETRVTKNAVPAFVWHTFADASVSVKNSLLLAMAYEEAGVPFTLHVFEAGKHGLSTADSAVYALNEIPEVSAGVTDWINMSINWLFERGFRVDDGI